MIIEKTNKNVDIITSFLYNHLDEYGDDYESIKKSLDYAFSSELGKGGFVLIGVIEDEEESEEFFDEDNIVEYDVFVKISPKKEKRVKLKILKFEKGIPNTTDINPKNIVGVLVINDTGMVDYIPEHILVYIAVHRDYRGLGIGRKLIEEAKKLCDGNIALHVEEDNPAKKLYEKVGFEESYIEMRC